MNKIKLVRIVLLIIFLSPNFILAQKNKKDIQNSIEKRAKEYESIAKSIWNWAELGYQEEKSSALLKKHYQMKVLALNLM